MTPQIDFENELQVIGAVLRDPSSIDRLSAIVNYDDFDYALVRSVWQTAQRLWKDSCVVTGNEIAQQSGMSDEEFRAIMDRVPTSANAEEYARLVVQAAQRRRMVELGDMLAQSNPGNADALMSKAYEFFTDAVVRRTTSQVLTSSDLCSQLWERIREVDAGKQLTQSTGYPELDKVLGGGFALGGMYVLAARPGIGKTSLALNIACKTKGPVLFISLEMSPIQLAMKRVAMMTGIPVGSVIRRRSTASQTDTAEMNKLVGITEAFCRSQMIVNRNPDMSVAEIGAMARGIKDLELIVVDYLGLIRPSNQKASRYEQVTDISRELKLLAIRLNLPILTLAQLNRVSETRKDKRPSLSDLRDSGAIEQDADGVILLHRPTYDSKEGETKGTGPTPLDAYLVKNRHGSTGKVSFDAYLNTGIIAAIH